MRWWWHMKLEPVGQDAVMLALLENQQLWVKSGDPALTQLSASLISENLRRAVDMLDQMGFVVARAVADESGSDPSFDVGFWNVVRYQEYDEREVAEPHGPYLTRDKAGIMGHHHARRAEQNGAWQPTYQVFENGQPVSGIRTTGQHWTKSWPEKERRECARCDLTIVSVSEGWIIVDSGVLVDGLVICPAGSNQFTSHTPKRQARRAEA
jgi:hypothetical protein